MLKIFVKGIVLSLFFVNIGQTKENISAMEIIRKANAIIYPENTIDTLEMRSIKPKKKENIYRMKRYRKSSEEILVNFFYPPAEAGRKFLRVGQNLWMYLPNIQRCLRISPKQTYMGGDFSNADMLRLNLIEDYVPELIGHEKIEDKECYVLNLKAKNRTIAYDVVKYWIEKETYFPVRQEFYTGSSKLIKILSFSSVKLLSGKERPSRLEMKNVLMKGHITIVDIKDMQENVDLPDYLFSPEYLKEE